MEQVVNEAIVNELSIQFKNLGLIDECINDVRNALVGVSNICKGEQKNIDEAYQKGLDDAWECMKKIAFLEKPRDMRDFFGHTTFGGILTGYTATEAIEKLKAYEGYSRDKDLCGGCVWEDRFDGDCSMCSNNYRWLYRAKETTNDIKVGDEVINNTTGEKGILLEPETQHLLATVIYPNKRWNTFNIRHRNLTKTGRHFDIEKLLETMKE